MQKKPLCHIEETELQLQCQRFSKIVCCLCVSLCSDVIREKGLEHVTVEDLVTEVTPKGRGTVVYTQHTYAPCESIM